MAAISTKCPQLISFHFSRPATAAVTPSATGGAGGFGLLLAAIRAATGDDLFYLAQFNTVTAGQVVKICKLC